MDKYMSISTRSPNEATKLKMLSFSPDDKFHLKHSNHITPSNNSRKLYQAYRQHNGQNQNPSKSFASNIANPEVNTLGQSKIRKTKKLVNNKGDIIKIEVRRVRAFSTNGMKNQNQYMNLVTKRPQTNQLSTYHCHNPQSKAILNNRHSSYQQYVNQKRTYNQFLQTRLQNQQDLTYLSRTFCSQRKELNQAKKELVNMLGKRINNQVKQREKEQHRQKQNDWLQRQKNQNNTKKYINQLVKYHAKKLLLQNNAKAAHQIRKKSQSASSLKSIKSILSTKQKFQRSKQMRQQNQQKINQAKSRSMNRIKEKSKSVRQSMGRVYNYGSGMEGWRIEQGQLRARQIAATIESSKRNKQTLTKMIVSGRGKCSQQIMSQLNKTLHSVRRVGFQ